MLNYTIMNVKQFLIFDYGIHKQCLVESNLSHCKLHNLGAMVVMFIFVSVTAHARQPSALHTQKHTDTHRHTAGQTC